MKEQNNQQPPPFVERVNERQEPYQRLVKFTRSSTKAAAVMLGAALVSIIIANTDFYFPFVEFWETKIYFGLGSWGDGVTLSHVINDILMTLFFLCIGLDIKYEMTVGEFKDIRQALLPVVAALGGVCVPIVIYLAFNATSTLTSHGWGVPTATDIAFALGIMSLLGTRVPKGLKVFLVTLAVADDIIAIIIIALFYGQSPSLFWLGASIVVLVVLLAINKARVFSLAPYVCVGIVLWYCVYMSGIHPTIAGVLLALTIPTESKINLGSFPLWITEKIQTAKNQFEPATPIVVQEEYMGTLQSVSTVTKHVSPPSRRLGKRLYPWVYFLVLPLFALCNADVRFVGGALEHLWTNPALPGIFFGLLLGKPLGIVCASFVVVKLKLAKLPAGARWSHMLGAGILGGLGFTMAIFVANLAFLDAETIAIAKLAVLSASVLAGIAGFLFLWYQARKDAKKEHA